MGDESSEIQKRRIAATEAFNEFEENNRRSVETSNSFYEKLASLDAGSIAVAVSVSGFLIAKPPVDNNLAYWLFAIIICLFVSLICSVVYNFIVVAIAKLGADYSECNVNVKNKELLIAHLEDMIIESDKVTPVEPIKRIITNLNMQEKQEVEPSYSLISLYLKGRERRINLAAKVGLASILSFLVAYGLVVVKFALLVFLH